MARIVALIPSISPRRLRDSREWHSALCSVDIEPYIVANARSVAAMDDIPHAKILDMQSNSGFAACINAAALMTGDWDWLVLLNDDISPSAQVATQLRSILDDAPAQPERGLINFDPEHPRDIPAVAGVLANISLAERIIDRFRQQPHRRARRGVRRATYKSFSATAISRQTWDSLGGLDDSFSFCYEDADFTWRFTEAYKTEPAYVPLDIAHNQSGSTKSHVARVLPVVTYSAYVYLTKYFLGPRGASFLLSIALLARVPLVIFSDSRKKDHLQGIVRSLRAMMGGKKPSLPAYSEL